MSRAPLGMPAALVVVAFVAQGLVAPRALAVPPGYAITYLGDLSESGISRINNLGHVVGTSHAVNGQLHAFLWRDGARIDLGVLAGHWSDAFDVNDADQVVGRSSVADPDSYFHAFIWQEGAMTDIGSLPGSDFRVEAWAINNLGRVVGDSSSRTSTRAFLWRDGTMIDLGTLGGNVSEARDINDRGQVVGRSRLADDSNHAYVWHAGMMTDLGVLDGYAFSEAWGINDHGQVVGQVYTWGGSDTRAFIWQNGVMSGLGTPGYDLKSCAYGINNSGQAVGVSSGPRGETAVIWENGAAVDLNSLIPGDSGWVLKQALGINDSGQIVCKGHLNGEWHYTALLTPVPEPPAMVVVILALGAIALRRR